MTSISEFKIAVVTSQFNPEITKRLETGALKRLTELNISAQYLQVPGAVEIPLIAKLLAQSKQYDAVICLGAIIQGETDHYDYVCQQVSYGCQKVMLEFSLPVIFGVLTTQNEQQALDRAGGKEGNKGIEAVDTAIVMIDLVKKLTFKPGFGS